MRTDAEHAGGRGVRDAVADPGVGDIEQAAAPGAVRCAARGLHVCAGARFEVGRVRERADPSACANPTGRAAAATGRSRPLSRPTCESGRQLRQLTGASPEPSTAGAVAGNVATASSVTSGTAASTSGAMRRMSASPRESVNRMRSAVAAPICCSPDRNTT